jgi:hypothetical protein
MNVLRRQDMERVFPGFLTSVISGIERDSRAGHT